MQIEVNEVSGNDVAVIYYVAGCIGRCVLGRRKCTSCKDLLTDGDNIPCRTEVTDVTDIENLLITIADHGGFSTPKQYCFEICALGVQLYCELS